MTYLCHQGEETSGSLEIRNKKRAGEKCKTHFRDQKKMTRTYRYGVSWMVLILTSHGTMAPGENEYSNIRKFGPEFWSFSRTFEVHFLVILDQKTNIRFPLANICFLVSLGQNSSHFQAPIGRTFHSTDDQFMTWARQLMTWNPFKEIEIHNLKKS